MASKTVTGVK